MNASCAYVCGAWCRCCTSILAPAVVGLIIGPQTRARGQQVSRRDCSGSKPVKIITQPDSPSLR